jgi:hypothetical protein
MLCWDIQNPYGICESDIYIVMALVLNCLLDANQLKLNISNDDTSS